MPDKVFLVHCIYTNDPRWLEEIWHKHFAHQRKFGSGKVKASEWFGLADADVREFKSHREWNNPEINTRSQLSLPLCEQKKTLETQTAVPNSVPHKSVNSRSQPTLLPASIPNLPPRFVAEAIIRVNIHFDSVLAIRSDRASKLEKAREWELSQIESAMTYYCEQRGLTQIEALRKWEKNACKSADAKIR